MLVVVYYSFFLFLTIFITSFKKPWSDCADVSRFATCKKRSV